MSQIDLRTAVPKELIDECRWVLWKRKCVRSKWRKIPYQPNGDEASVSDPSKWHSFDECWQVRSSFDGLGFVLGDGFAGIDLDDVYDRVNGLTEEAKAIVKRFETYWEISPSGKGIKGFGKVNSSDLPALTKSPLRSGGSIEMYAQKRYFTVTGEKYSG